MNFKFARTLLLVAVICGLINLGQVATSVFVMQVPVSKGKCLSPYGALEQDQSIVPSGDCVQVTCDADSEILQIERCGSSNLGLAENVRGKKARVGGVAFPACCWDPLI
ncbi:uncharacterized protein LOC144106654 [Amblyomma americanum]